jgi:cellobiose phosphorylase
MGTGDWNDGMDLVGEEGKGESVWLTWFLSHVLERFSSVCEQMGERARGTHYRAVAQKLAGAANEAWDGAWFLRGYYDDGSTLGSHRDEFCQLDSIAQSFASLSGFADREKAEQAISSAVERLFDKDAGIVKIFDPPFDRGDRDPGYIRGYVPGVRENGGQYTHAAVWLAMACFRLGRTGDGYDILNALLPANHATEVYRAEPYVLAAVSNPTRSIRLGAEMVHRGGGWYYRTVCGTCWDFRVREEVILSPICRGTGRSAALPGRTEEMDPGMWCLYNRGTLPQPGREPVQTEWSLRNAPESILRFTFG